LRLTNPLVSNPLRFRVRCRSRAHARRDDAQQAVTRRRTPDAFHTCRARSLRARARARRTRTLTTEAISQGSRGKGNGGIAMRRCREAPHGSMRRSDTGGRLCKIEAAPTTPLAHSGRPWGQDKGQQTSAHATGPTCTRGPNDPSVARFLESCESRSAKRLLGPPGCDLSRGKLHCGRGSSAKHLLGPPGCATMRC